MKKDVDTTQELVDLANDYNQQFYTTNFTPTPAPISTFTSNSPVIDSAEIQENNLESDIKEEDMTDNVIITETIVTVEEEEVETSAEEADVVADETEEKAKKEDGNNII